MSLIAVAEAFQRLCSACPDWGVETVAARQARGRVLAQDLRADRDVPPFDRVVMDGVALSYEEWRRGRRTYRVAGIQATGSPPLELPAADCALEVMTGAVLPAGCDVVVPVEELTRTDDHVTLAEGIDMRQHQHVHARASDHPAGAIVLPAGLRLASPALAVAAAVGATSLRVRRLPRLALLATGSELVPAEQAPAPWQIRASNGPALEAALGAAGFPVAWSRLCDDDPERLGRAIDEALAEADLLVLSGAVSQGRYDHVPALLRAAGAELLFHGVAQRPGKPLLAARLPEGRLALGLPGNPVSALVCLHRYLLPAVRQALGLPWQPRRVLLERAWPLERLAVFQPVALEEGPDGLGRARPRPTAGSGDFTPLAQSDGFVELDPASAPGEMLPAGSLLPFHPWH